MIAGSFVACMELLFSASAPGAIAVRTAVCDQAKLVRRLSFGAAADDHTSNAAGDC